MISLCWSTITACYAFCEGRYAVDARQGRNNGQLRGMSLSHSPRVAVYVRYLNSGRLRGLSADHCWIPFACCRCGCRALHLAPLFRPHRVRYPGVSGWSCCDRVNKRETSCYFVKYLTVCGTLQSQLHLEPSINRSNIIDSAEARHIVLRSLSADTSASTLILLDQPDPC